MSQEEVVLTDSVGQCSLHQLSTGKLLEHFKNASGASNPSANTTSILDHVAATLSPPRYRKTTSCLLGQNGTAGMILSYGGPSKGAITSWSFANDGVAQKSTAATTLSCLALSPNGLFLAAGTPDQRLLLWNVNTGQLVTECEPHYQTVTAVAWTSDSQALVTASKDAQIKVFTLSALLQVEQQKPREYAALNDHTDAITDIAMGTGLFPSIRILSSSLDGSVKMWSLEDPLRPLLATWQLPAPSHAHLLAWPPLENCFFVAYKQTSPSLKSDTSKSKPTDSADTPNVVRRIDLYRPAEDEAGHTAYQPAVAQGSTELVQPPQGDEYVYTSQVDITALHLSTLSPRLLVGTSASSVHVLALPSLQSIRTINPSSGLSSLPPKNPITFIQTFVLPVEVAQKSMGQSKKQAPDGLQARHAPRLAMSLTPKGGQGRTEHSVRIGQSDFNPMTALLPSRLRKPAYTPTAPLSTYNSAAPAEAAAAGSSSSSTDSQVQQLQAQNAELQKQLAKAVDMSESLWKGVVDGSLKYQAGQ